MKVVPYCAKNHNVLRADCDYCDEFLGGFHNTFRSLYGGAIESRVLHKTQNFRVFPTIGQLVEGYLLIAPERHYAAIDEMPCELVEELADLCTSLEAIVSQMYGPTVWFEHGVRGPVNGGCGIYHAHLHFMPFSRASEPLNALQQQFSFQLFSDFQELTKQSVLLPSYLLYRNPDARLYLFDTGPLPSQYMRKLLAESLSDQNWDWRKAGREETLIMTMRRLAGQLSELRETTSHPQSKCHY
jgi:diadenosine tetraphosphate (Ap4A) HIT family hydrolase